MAKNTLYIVGTIILLWLIYRVVYMRKKKREYHRAFLETFSNRGIQMPILKIRNSYGYPSFEVTFENEEQFEFAKKNELTKHFEKRIQKIHEDIKDFEVNRAVYFTWEGRIYNFITTRDIK